MKWKQRVGDVVSIGRGVAQCPRATLELPRLARSVGRPTLEQRVPWLPFVLVDFLASRVTTADRVFEFGGGGSTLWFAARAGSVITVEHDADWVNVLGSRVAGLPNVTLLNPEDGVGYAEYVQSIDAYDDDAFTVVVVDGR